MPELPVHIGDIGVGGNEKTLPLIAAPKDEAIRIRSQRNDPGCRWVVETGRDFGSNLLKSLQLPCATMGNQEGHLNNHRAARTVVVECVVRDHQVFAITRVSKGCGIHNHICTGLVIRIHYPKRLGIARRSRGNRRRWRCCRQQGNRHCRARGGLCLSCYLGRARFRFWGGCGWHGGGAGCDQQDHQAQC